MDRNLQAWMIVAVGFVGLATSFTARSALGLSLLAWEAEFGWTRTTGSASGAMALVVMACVAPFTGNLVDRYGPRSILALGLAAVGGGMLLLTTMREPWQLWLGYSLLGGLGFGTMAMHVVSTGVAGMFATRRGLAIGIATAGATAGQLLLMPVVGAVSVAAGWRWSFAMLGVLALVLAPIGFRLLRAGARDRPAKPLTASEPLGPRVAALMRSATFQALLWSFVICGFTTSGVIEVHLLPYAAACGFPPQATTLAYGILAAFNLCGMIAAGHLADRVHRPLLLGGIYIMRGLSFLLLMGIADDYALLVMFAVMFGLFDYATVPVTASLVASHLGMRVMGLAMGLLSAGHALGAALGAYFGGVLFELYAKYLWVWVAALVLALGAGFISFTIRERRLTPAAA